ncbi:MAG: hypothetical protein QG583_653 [Patescibacteria group bacterium]|nr:hypothetical protein [Patescibacteria group bacterium]
MKKHLEQIKNMPKHKKYWWSFLFFVLFAGVLLIFPGYLKIGKVTYSKETEKKSVFNKIEQALSTKKEPVIPVLDKEDYDKRILTLANNPPPPAPKTVTDPNTGVVTTITPPAPNYLWPKKTVYPNAGAILPFKRIVAYYGNLYSKKMGALGEYEESVMLAKLNAEVKKWEAADPETPVMPALHYIAVVAQGSAGADGMYRARMPDSEIDKVIAMAAKINAIVFLDIQNGFSTVEKEIPKFEKYLKMPNVHLGLDPEFSMKSGIRPGKIVGTMDAADINFAINYLSNLVKTNNLPPKVLIVHRYTQKMFTNYQNIKPTPEVQIVVHMDGWGGKAKKINTFKQFVYKEPVQFAGFKIFYKNDIKDPNTVIFSPAELMKLNPRPVYIQYQ